MDFFPFPLKETSQGLYQRYTFIRPRNIFTKGRLEKIISKIALNPNIANSSSGIQGIIGEQVGRDLFSYHMKALLEKKFSHFEGKMIRNDKDYVINKNQNYLAKLLNRDQVVILSDKQRFNCNEGKYGLENIAEIDGLYLVKRIQKNQKNGKRLIVLETKTGSDSFNPQKIESTIINPLQELYDTPVSYLVIGFEEELYTSHKRHNHRVNEKFTFLYDSFKEKNIDFSCIHFPFEKKRLLEFSRDVEKQLQEQIQGQAIYDKKTGIITIKDFFGRNHTFYTT